MDREWGSYAEYEARLEAQSAVVADPASIQGALRGNPLGTVVSIGDSLVHSHYGAGRVLPPGAAPWLTVNFIQHGRISIPAFPPAASNITSFNGRPFLSPYLSDPTVSKVSPLDSSTPPTETYEDYALAISQATAARDALLAVLESLPENKTLRTSVSAALGDAETHLAEIERVSDDLWLNTTEVWLGWEPDPAYWGPGDYEDDDRSLSDYDDLGYDYDSQNAEADYDDHDIDTDGYC